MECEMIGVMHTSAVMIAARFAPMARAAAGADMTRV